MDNMPLVSVNCLVYNHEPYLRKCLEGFVMQKTNFSFEVLVHDDASTDDSANIIREYEEKYPDIIKPIYQKVNQYSKRDGSISKIQRERALGKYYAFCEGDDYWIDPLKLQKQVDFMEHNPEFSLCFHDCKVYNQSNHEFSSSWLDLNHSREISPNELLLSINVPTFSMMFKTYDYLQFSPYICKAPVGDYPAVVLSCKFGRAFYINEVMGIYRKNRPGSWSMQKRDLAFIVDYYFKFECFLFFFNRYTKLRFIYFVLLKQIIMIFSCFKQIIKLLSKLLK